MKNSIPAIEELEGDMTGNKLIESHQFWLKRRIAYNIIVGLTGVMSCIAFLFLGPLILLFGAIVWGITMNAFYSLGYVVESYMITKTRWTNGFSKTGREVLFVLGTMASVFATLFVALPLWFWA